ncbi:MAG: hypothetical protein NC120_05425 [Ruminococcus sp.]|nr:hypothetical protein [Ruminococcus sp.]
MAKLTAVLILAVIGMCFMYPGFVRISDIGKTDKTRALLGYFFGLCSAGWLTIHFIVTANVFIFSQAEKYGGRELAVTLSGGFAQVGTAALYGSYLFVAAALIALPAAILSGKTYLKKRAAVFTPFVPMAVISEIEELLPASPFSYGMYTFCMNGGMIVWFIYLIIACEKIDRRKERGSVKNG